MTQAQGRYCYWTVVTRHKGKSLPHTTGKGVRDRPPTFRSGPVDSSSHLKNALSSPEGIHDFVFDVPKEFQSSQRPSLDDVQHPISLREWSGPGVLLLYGPPSLRPPAPSDPRERRVLDGVSWKRYGALNLKYHQHYLSVNSQNLSLRYISLNTES